MDSSASLRRGDTLRSRGPPLRILSFGMFTMRLNSERELTPSATDGGGVRGLSSLLLLEQLLQRVVSLLEGDPRHDTVSDTIRPCEYFDLIGGTGTGGLLAIMLGRLRMTLGQCKAIFTEMTQVVFQSDKMIAGLPYKSTLFKASKLEDAIRACVQEYEHEQSGVVRTPPASPQRQGSVNSYRTTMPRRRSSLSNYGGRPGSYSMTRPGNPDATLHDPRKDRTKTAVAAVLQGSKTGTNVLLRSYPSYNERTIEPNCTIWQAGRATCASGLAFKPIQIGTSIFQDLGTGRFNPAREILDEAILNEWPGREVGFFLSLGCGIRKKKAGEDRRQWWEGMASELADARRRLNAKIDACEEIHKALITVKGGNGEKNKGYLALRGVDENHYLRLNVDEGVGDVEMNHYNDLVVIQGSTQAYLQKDETRQYLAKGAEALWEVQCQREGRLRPDAGRPEQMPAYEDHVPAYQPPAPAPNVVELPGEDPPSLYPRPLSRPGPQYPAMYPHPFEQASSPQDKFLVTPSDEAPQTLSITPRISEDGSFRPSSELYGSDRPYEGDPRVSIDSMPPPLPPKTPLQYHDDPRRYTMPHGTNMHPSLPYPDDDGPPPVINFARKPQFVKPQQFANR
ncbi:MAG: hypothetical protein Q9174_001864 [Haloplaca sp. 1 TL-2023]